jgi:thiamine biosynthesis lipoprotein
VTTPTEVPSNPLGRVGLTADELWHSTFRAMASPVRVQLGRDTRDPGRVHAAVRDLVDQVERQCTRFDPTSDLMQANVAGDGWHQVGVRCYDALVAAERAHAETAGVFEPRVLRVLADLGYASSWPADGRPAGGPAAPGPVLGRAPRWTPGFDAATRSVRVGPDPIDLGGIGKGLALRWTADLLAAAGATSYLVDAGGDCVFRGGGPDGSGWHIGVEDPRGGIDPMAVLAVTDGACATSSTRLRRWRAGGEEVHHLIDPSTRRPGGGGLRAVTVVADDPADAEVWSKTLFLRGAAIAEAAECRGLAALWIDADGTLAASPAMQPHLIWTRP